ncbi:MAG: recombinase family protein [Anaerolineales bacterium]|nr:recombinase family protein [Anaerolineales bacterium]MCA9946572.1 recombinase family protein [Anaerolineales bacterium]MCB8939220.1 recombinase family protein [Ardenticatenaceae bacterium]
MNTLNNGVSEHNAKRAVIYARVSSKVQSENGYGLKYQIADCKAYAAMNELEVVEIIRDDITGVTRLEERKGGRRLLKLLEQRSFDHLIVWRLDRLARPPKHESSRILTTIEQFARGGVTVHDCDGGENDPTQLAGGLLAFIKSYQAGEERETIRKRTLKGKRERVKDGHWVGMFPPYGYDKVGERKKARLVINEAEARIVRRIFEHFVGANGREKMSMTAIARMLNKEGVPIPGQKRRMNTRGKWKVGGIREYILKNPRYIGKIKSVGTFLDMPELAIVDKELFELAQKQLQINKKRHYERRPKLVYLLSARFLCHCGKAMVGGATSVRNAKNEKVYYPYYRCSNRYGPYKGECDQLNLRKEDIDDLVWAWLKDLLKDEEALDDGLDELEKQAKEQLEPKKQSLETVEALLVKMESKIAKLVNAFAEMEDPTVAKAIQEQIKLAVNQKEGLIREKAGLEVEIESIDISSQTRKRVKETAKKIRQRLPGASKKDKQDLMDMIGLEGQLLHLESGELAIRLSCVIDSRIFCFEEQDS